MNNIQENFICKKCGFCGNSSEFSADSSRPRGFRLVCKPCSNKRRKAYWDKLKSTPEGLLHYQNIKKSEGLRLRYGMTLKEKEVLLQSQNNQCAICKKVLCIDQSDCHIDHCHKTNKIRGILCVECNLFIGGLEKHLNSGLLKEMLSYLEKEII